MRSNALLCIAVGVLSSVFILHVCTTPAQARHFAVGRYCDTYFGYTIATLLNVQTDVAFSLYSNRLLYAAPCQPIRLSPAGYLLSQQIDGLWCDLCINSGGTVVCWGGLSLTTEQLDRTGFWLWEWDPVAACSSAFFRSNCDGDCAACGLTNSHLYDATLDCVECLDQMFDPAASCTQCKNTLFDPAQDCLQCTNTLADYSVACTLCTNRLRKIGTQCTTCVDSGKVLAMECACPPGTQNDGTLASPLCSSCAAGYYNENGASCTKCAKGNYSAASGSAVCKPCPKGTYAASLGTQKCTLCPPNKYNPNTASISVAACLPCSPNEHAEPGSWMCTATLTLSDEATKSMSETAEATPTASISHTKSTSMSETAEATPTASISHTKSTTRAPTPTISDHASVSASPLSSVSPSASITHAATPSASVSLTSTASHYVANPWRVDTLSGGAASGMAFRLGEFAFETPSGVCIRNRHHILVADSGKHAIRDVELSTGFVTTLIDNGAGCVDGDASVARLHSPKGLALRDSPYAVYIADSGNHKIRSLLLDRMAVATVAGSGAIGSLDAVDPLAATFGDVSGVALCGSVLYAADTSNDVIRSIALPNGPVLTLAGSAGVGGNVDAVGSAARFGGPTGILCDGTILIVSERSSHVREVNTTSGEVTTVAGAGGPGFVDRVPAHLAKMSNVSGLCASPTMDIAITDWANNMVRLWRRNGNGKIEVLAGSGQRGYQNGEALHAQFEGVAACVWTSDTTLIVIEELGNRVRRVFYEPTRTSSRSHAVGSVADAIRFLLPSSPSSNGIRSVSYSKKGVMRITALPWSNFSVTLMGMWHNGSDVDEDFLVRQQGFTVRIVFAGYPRRAPMEWSCPDGFPCVILLDASRGGGHTLKATIRYLVTHQELSSTLEMETDASSIDPSITFLRLPATLCTEMAYDISFSVVGMGLNGLHNTTGVGATLFATFDTLTNSTALRQRSQLVSGEAIFPAVRVAAGTALPCVVYFAAWADNGIQSQTWFRSTLIRCALSKVSYRMQDDVQKEIMVIGAPRMLLDDEEDAAPPANITCRIGNVSVVTAQRIDDRCVACRIGPFNSTPSSGTHELVVDLGTPFHALLHAGTVTIGGTPTELRVTLLGRNELFSDQINSTHSVGCLSATLHDASGNIAWVSSTAQLFIGGEVFLQVADSTWRACDFAVRASSELVPLRVRYFNLAANTVIAESLSLHFAFLSPRCHPPRINKVVGCALGGCDGTPSSPCGCTESSLITMVVAASTSNISTHIDGPACLTTVLGRQLDAKSALLGSVVVTATGCSNKNAEADLEVWFEEGRFARARNPIGFGAFPPSVQVFSVSGCYDAFPSTGLCPTTGAQATVTVRGIGFMRVVDVGFETPGWAPPVCSSFTVVDDHLLYCNNISGFGALSVLQLELRSGTILRSHSTSLSFRPGRELHCGRGSDGALCSRHGTCNGMTGVCECFNDDYRGHFASASCTQCHPFYNGSSDCRQRCPGAEAPCSGRGSCMGGTCFCDPGYVGASCEFVCRGLGGECSGHGKCFGIGECACFNDTLRGFWRPPECALCVQGYSGASCTMPCPTNGTHICSANGACVDGVCRCFPSFCGATCSLPCNRCPSALYGAECESACVGGTSAPCFFKGRCWEGRHGDGSCTCAHGFGGVDCSNLCPGGADPPCNGNGLCSPVTLTCSCAPLFGTATCGKACPGNVTHTCSLRGRCLQGSFAPATCSCALGFSGYDCSQLCPSGNSAPCSSHGVCRSDATCECFASNSTGYWAGIDCSQCATGWHGWACKEQCPTDGSTECHGHGICKEEPVACECFASFENGFWALKNGTCGACKEGFYGPTCTQPCPGPLCQPCSGHGSCSDGLAGTGQCTCHFSNATGFWDGADCGLCSIGHWGPKCQGTCSGYESAAELLGLHRDDRVPISMGESFKSLLCAGHGSCSDEPSGDGGCVCSAGWTLNDEGSCTVCLPWHYGPSCGACNCSAVGGSCDDGLAGSGECRCHLGFGGAACNYVCPFKNTTCDHGFCTANSTCSCETNWATDAEGSCTVCAQRMYGAACSLRCGDCAYGRCRDGVNGDGACVCVTGFWGSRCENECLGGWEHPCNNHGQCDPASGACACYQDDLHGFFAGGACQICNPRYLSSNCSIPCPSINGAVCSGRGTCWDGVCSDCAPTAGDVAQFVCGEVCHLTDFRCFNFDNECPQGFWGAGCLWLCPGALTDGSQACSLHGVCSTDTGVCYCSHGYTGVDCSLMCPSAFVRETGTIMACSGRGACLSDSTCRCRAGYYGVDCAAECPGGAIVPCNGFGSCDAALGTCECMHGTYGNACEHVCPGGRTSPCFGHGACQRDGSCLCHANMSHGFWSETSFCAHCTYGYGGGDCRLRCHGPSTVPIPSRLCECMVGYAGPSCDVSCPGVAVGSVCSGHGSCNDGHDGNGMCVCDVGWFGADCSVFCTADLCQLQLRAVHVMCDTASGACACARGLDGQYDGPTCDDCAVFSWGFRCQLACDCNKHGGCERYTGECVCFDDELNGHWGGGACTRCKDGYIGIDCRRKNVELSVNGDRSAFVTAAYSFDSIIFVDASMDFAYIGSTTLVALDLSTRPPRQIAHVALGGRQLLSGSVVNSSHLELMLLLSNGALDGLMLPRGTSPILPAYQTHHSTATSRHLQQASHSVCSASDGRVSVVLSFPQLVLSISIATSLVATIPVSEHGIASVKHCAVTASTANESLVIVSGSSAAQQWIVGVVAVDPLRGVLLSRSTFSSRTVEVGACGSASDTTCSSARRCVLDGTVVRRVVCVMSHPDGPLLVSFESAAASRSRFVLLSETHVPWNVTALIIDSSNDEAASVAVVAAINVVASSSTVFRVALAAMAVSSVFQLAGSSSKYEEIITSVALEPRRRELYALVQTPVRSRWLSVNLFGLLTVTPSVADASGGAALTVVGEGFGHLEDSSCQFSDGSASPATLINSTTLVCVARPTVVMSGMCVGEHFNVRLNGRVTATTNVFIQRPTSVVLLQAVVAGTNDTFVAKGTRNTVIIHGYTFTPSPHAKCVIQLPDTAASEATRIDLPRVTVLNTSAVSCEIPPTVPSTDVGSVLAYSHDGVVFAASTVLFAVVGDPSGLSIASPAQATAIVSSRMVDVPTVEVHVTDAHGNSVHQYDSAHRLIICSHASDDNTTYSFSSPNVTRQYSTKGVAQFGQLRLNKPKSGGFSIVFSHEAGFALWSATLTLVILVGAPHQIVLLNSNATSQWVVGTREAKAVLPPPEAGVVDSAGNLVTNPSVLPITLTLTAATAEWAEGGQIALVPIKRAAMASKGTGRYLFDRVMLRSAFGRACTLRISENGSDLVEYSSNALPLQGCMDGTEYGVVGSFACKKCPRHGICDGSSNVKCDEAFWRSHPTSNVFYECADNACRKGDCKTGYTGPRCSVCTTGFGKTSSKCTLCGSSAVNWVLIILSVLCLCLVVAFLVSNSIRSGEVQSTKRRTVSLVLKQLLTHLQTISLVAISNEQLPSAFHDSFRAANTASTISPDIYFVSCELAHNYYDRMVFTMLLPVLFIALFAVVNVVDTAIRRYVRQAGKSGNRDEDGDEASLSAYRVELLTGHPPAPTQSSRPSVSFDLVSLTSDGHRSLLDATVRLSDAYIGIAPNDGSAAPNINPLSQPHGEMASVSKGSPAFVRPEGYAATWFYRTSVTIIVVLFLLFPPVLEVGSRMLVCESLDYGDLGIRQVLVADRSISCDATQYLVFRAIAIGCVFVYGAGIPLASIAIVKVVAYYKGGDFEAARRLFFFTTGSFKKQWWMWEGVILVRRAIIVVTVSVVSDRILRTYAAMWVLGAFLAINSCVMPWNEQHLSYLEALSLVTISITFNLSLMFDYLSESSNPAVYYIVVAFILAVNALALLAFAWALVESLRNVLIEMGVLTSISSVDELSARVETNGATLLHLRTAAARLRDSVANEAAQWLLAHSNDVRAIGAVWRYAQYRSQVLLRLTDRRRCAEDLHTLYRLERDVMDRCGEALHLLEGRRQIQQCPITIAFAEAPLYVLDSEARFIDGPSPSVPVPWNGAGDDGATTSSAEVEAKPAGEGEPSIFPTAPIDY